MIVTVAETLKIPELSALSKTEIEEKLKAIELLARAYTHNNFQNRAVRFAAENSGSTLLGYSPFLRVGDTVEISQSGVNDGLYTVDEVGDTYTAVNGVLFNAPYNLVTKVEYPADIRDGVLNLLKWEGTMRNKVGVKSETLSRYSVTYYDQDSNNQVMGYPVSLLGFLKPYMKARF